MSNNTIKRFNGIGGINCSIEPTIRSGGMPTIDTFIQEYISDGVYLIRQGKELKIKRLQQITYDKVLIISDNKEVYPPLR